MENDWTYAKYPSNRRISNYEDNEVLDLLSETFVFAMQNFTNAIRRNELSNGWRKLGYVGTRDNPTDFEAWLRQERVEYHFEKWEIEAFANTVPSIKYIGRFAGSEECPRTNCYEYVATGGINRCAVNYPSIHEGEKYDIDEVLAYYGRKREV